MNGLTQPPTRKRGRRSNTESQLLRQLTSKVVGQEQAMRSIVPCVQMYEAGLGPEGRPAGIFLLLGPTGTGKTRTVEALAEVLHGSRRQMIRVDCGEFQMDHEVAKLTGAPPGYLGHRETHPILTQARLSAVTSESCSLSIVLFDEIEKAAPSMTRILLGLLDKASLRLGDNNVVNFERTLIFMTSNIGASQMQQVITPGFGFQTATSVDRSAVAKRLDNVAVNAAKRAFAPEFLNRIDELITYQPLSDQSLQKILDIQLTEFQNHLNNRLGPRAFRLEFTPALRTFLLRRGASIEYGARELKRAVYKHVAQPVAQLMIEGNAGPGSLVRLTPPTIDENGDDLPVAA